MPFQNTRWSLVVSAGMDSPEGEKALSELCRVYWPPVFAFVARKGYSRPEAEDLVQEFFARLLAKGSIRQARPERGKFRTFLLTAVNHFLMNEWDRRNAQKRRGDLWALPLDELSERHWTGLTSRVATPEECFERQWALTLLDRALLRVEKAQSSCLARSRFQELRGYLTASEVRVPYAELGRRLESSEGAMKVAVHRLRREYAESIREEVAETLPIGTDVDAEIRNLIESLGHGPR